MGKSASGVRSGSWRRAACDRREPTHTIGAMLSYRCPASLGELPCHNGFAEGGFCDTLKAKRAQKALVLLNGFSNRVIARRDNPDCLRELSGKPLLKRLPQCFHV